MAEAFQGLGFVVHTMATVYPGGEDEHVEDTRWIEDADHAGWVALTKDERITRYPEEQDALFRTTLRVFAIGNQHLTGPEMVAYYTTNIHRIVQRSRKPGPFVDIVYRNGVERRWPCRQEGFDTFHTRPGCAPRSATLTGRGFKSVDPGLA